MKLKYKNVELDLPEIFLGGLLGFTLGMTATFAVMTTKQMYEYNKKIEKQMNNPDLTK